MSQSTEAADMGWHWRERKKHAKARGGEGRVNGGNTNRCEMRSEAWGARGAERRVGEMAKHSRDEERKNVRVAGANGWWGQTRAHTSVSKLGREGVARREEREKEGAMMR